MNFPDRSLTTLKLAIHGVPEQSSKIMRLFFQQLSKEVVVIDTVAEADIHVIDMDHSASKDIFAKLRHKHRQAVFILTSLTEPKVDSEIIFLKKPLAKQTALIALKQGLSQLKKQTATFQREITTEKPNSKPVNKLDNHANTPDNHHPISRRQPSKQFNDKVFSNFIGLMADIDFDDPNQLNQASFSPKNYFFYYVYNAIKVAHQKGMVLEINAGWKPLIIFPHSREIWIDATDHQLRAFARLKITSSGENKITFSPVNVKDLPNDKQDGKFQSEESLLWKLALWTSKGRYPTNIDPKKTILLKHWPNLTRLVIPPHALRICALLIKQPQSMLDVAKSLNIGPQYVFVFITACSALNLVTQVDQAPVVKNMPLEKNSGLLSKILSKLRTKTDHDST